MKKEKTPNIVFLAIMTTITTIFWAFFGVYRVFTTKPEVTISSEVVEPIDPSLDTSIIDKMQNSVYFEEGQVVSPTPESSESSTAAGSISQ